MNAAVPEHLKPLPDCTPFSLEGLEGVDFSSKLSDTTAVESVVLRASEGKSSRSMSGMSEEVPAQCGGGGEVTAIDEDESSCASSEEDAGTFPEPDAAAGLSKTEEASGGIFNGTGYQPIVPPVVEDGPSLTFGFDFDDLPEPVEDFSRTVSQMTLEESAIPGTVNDDVLDVAQSPCSVAGGGLMPLQPVPLQHRTVQRPPKVGTAGHRVGIVVNGTIGDVNPFVALAHQLTSFRHSVRVFTACNHVDFFAEHGLDAVPVYPDSRAVMVDMGGMVQEEATVWSNGGRASQAWLAEHGHLCVDSQEAIRHFRPHVLLAGCLAMDVAFRYEEAWKVPVLPLFLSFGAMCTFKEYYATRRVRPTFLCLSPLLDTTALEPPLRGLHRTAECVLYEVPSPRDLQEGGRLAHLRRFLGSGRPPVLVGWGSMLAGGMRPVEMLILALRALRAAGARGVIVGGWAELDKLALRLEESLGELGGGAAAELAAFAEREVCFVDSAPHEWLFPQCCSLVHHGGVGTWQAGVRAGKPAVITPVFSDQFHHSALTEQLGIGIGLKKPLQETTHQELARAIGLVETRAAAAEALGKRMRSQVGEREVAVVVDKYVRERQWEREQQKRRRRDGRPAAPE